MWRGRGGGGGGGVKGVKGVGQRWGGGHVTMQRGRLVIMGVRLGGVGEGY